MIVHITGPVKRSYAEMLCLLFYPGSKFPENEPVSPDTVICDIHAIETHGFVFSDVTLTQGIHSSTGHAEIPLSDHPSKERAVAVAVGQAFFDAGTQKTGKRPPWGILTGVRPSKVSSEFLRLGFSEEEVVRILSEQYLTLPAKAQLVTTISKIENAIVEKQTGNRCSLYIAIPFCPTRCAYCSFVSFTSPKLLSLIPSYLEFLLEDLHRTVDMIHRYGYEIATVYIGGGTPTTLNESQLERLLSSIAKEIDISKLEEFTLEAGRPDTISQEKLSIAHRYGVSRISVNCQTLNESVLQHIGRHHSVAQFFQAYDWARESGIRDINVDLIAGLETDTLESFQHSLDQILSLRPSNITVHTFSVKNAADVRKDNRAIYDLSPKIASESVAYSQKVLLENQYVPYYIYRQKNMVGNLENVGYSWPGHEGLYNIYMMEEIHSIFGVGASAVTKFLKKEENGYMKIERFYEPKYPYEYLSDDREERWSRKETALTQFLNN